MNFSKSDLNSESSDHSDRQSASQAFLDALASLDETFGDAGALDLTPDTSIAKTSRPSPASRVARKPITGSDSTTEP
ncbi:MAG: hypothetical protein EAZ61_01155 [Oscillatoriales cyanobacterium]|jgi:hypothetical protein|nr:MAG: hypothetical protein EAZ61_01155 [Oscillatoriales cyanobacterium]